MDGERRRSSIYGIYAILNWKELKIVEWHKLKLVLYWRQPKIFGNK